MREIKFRGKCKKDGKWYFGNLYDIDTYGRTHICTINGGCLNIDPNTVGQFTGLCDSVGNPIYEGDILRFGNSPNGVCEVKYNEVITAFCIRFLSPILYFVICDPRVENIAYILHNQFFLSGGEK